MAWGVAGNIITTNLDSGADDPSLARADLKTALDELKAVINGRNATNGVAGLDGSGLIPAGILPDTIESSVGNNLDLQPDTEKVTLQNVLNLNPQTVTQLNARTDKAAGDIAYCSNGDAGSACVAVYDGSNWTVVALGSSISAT